MIKFRKCKKQLHQNYLSDVASIISHIESGPRPSLHTAWTLHPSNAFPLRRTNALGDSFQGPECFGVMSWYVTVCHYVILSLFLCRASLKMHLKKYPGNMSFVQLWWLKSHCENMNISEVNSWCIKRGVSNLWKWLRKIYESYLVGGFNPFEKY